MAFQKTLSKLSRSNYFNSLPMASQLEQLAQCRFMQRSEFDQGIAAIKGKKIVIVGCGAQGLNQGLNMRDSGCDVSYTLRKEAIDAKRASYVNATTNGFTVGTYDELIPDADLVLNLTPDKQHTPVVNAVMPLMKKGATLAYSHGFNIVEEGMQVRPDLTVIMVAPKCPGTEVRNEYLRGFGVPTLLAVRVILLCGCVAHFGLSDVVVVVVGCSGRSLTLLIVVLVYFCCTSPAVDVAPLG